MAVTLSPARRARGGTVARTRARPRRGRPGLALLLALLAALAYAVFADGAASMPEESRLQVGLAVVALVAAGPLLFGDAIGLRASRAAWVGVALLAGFAAWAGVTLLWSVAPSETWAALNRALAYVLVVVLAIAAGSSAPRAVERLALGWLAIAVAAALYALGGKVLPGVNVPGVFDLNHTRDLSRLRAPLEYWNALGLVCVLGVPVAMRVATDAARRRAVRLSAVGAAFLLLVCLGMTYSRGAFLSLAVAVALMTWLGGARLRGLVVVGSAWLATLPVLGFAFLTPALTVDGADLGARITAGRQLGVVMLVCLLGLLVAGWGLLQLEGRVRWTPRRSRRVWQVAGAGAAALALLTVVGVATSERGLTGSVEQAAESFTATSADEVTDPLRLVSTSSSNRWAWWQEAVGAFADRPLGGWGAGSFPVTHLLYRTEPIPVRQPHSVPLQFLAETGLVGAMLALGGLAVLLGAALTRVRAMDPGRERDFAVALVAGSCAWLVHGLVDWDWDIPGVTLPALAFLGVAVARGARPQRPPAAATAAARGLAAPEAGGAARAAALVGCVLLLCAVITSAVLPAWAASRADDALTTAAGGSEADRARAAADAAFAAKLDPVAVEPLFASATVAETAGRLADAKAFLLEAVDRQPWKIEAWARLTQLSLATADRDAFRAAGRKLLELDPAGPGPRALVERGGLFVTPPGMSATATGTPLSPAGPVAPQPPPAPTP